MRAGAHAEVFNNNTLSKKKWVPNETVREAGGEKQKRVTACGSLVE